MKPINRLNPSGSALLFGGLLWLLSGVRIPTAVLTRPTPFSLDIGPYMLAPAALLLLAGMVGLATPRLAALGAAGMLGLGAAAAGCIAVAGAGLAGSGRGDSALAPGLILLSAGLLLIGSRLMIERSRRGWQVLPLLLGLLGLLLPMGAGVQGAPGLASWLVFGLGWLWLGSIALFEGPVTAPERG